MFFRSLTYLATTLIVLTSPIAAQIDYRNVDDHRPTLTEDAYPIERYAWEVMFPYHYEREADRSNGHVMLLELTHSPLRNFHFGIKTPLAVIDPPTGESSGLALSGVKLYGLYNFFTEGPWLPALSVRADLSLPWGELGGDATHATIKAIATKSWGLTRVHLNAARSFGNSDRLRAAAEPAADWWLSAAIDRTFFRQSALLIAEVYARRIAATAPVEVTATLGTRYQWTPTIVLDFGLSRRLRANVGPDFGINVGLSYAFALRGTMPRGPHVTRAVAASTPQRRDDQFYYPGSFNWSFLDRYPEGARLFNAFDYGHAILYERLLTKPQDLTSRIEDHDYQYLTTDLLSNPPRFAVAEEAIEGRYAQRLWRAKQMFDWAHVLHRQIYDVYADERLSTSERDILIERLTDYYLSNAKYAFAPVPKSMALMDEQYYSQVFRHEYPKFNGLIWAYHWLQVGLYEPLIEGTTRAEKKAGLQAAVARFWSMLTDAPARMPSVMPMTTAVAPRFAAAHPRAAIIFDNLHMMHDIISDILAADTVRATDKVRVINAALDELQDPTTNLISMEMWRNMADHMGGVAAMGGPATGLLTPRTPTTAKPPTPAAADHSQHQPPSKPEEM